eukprot:m.35117 g.35117  ORF g.35117 m.35117 type:complete len:400 (+) comp17086_c1_seq1:164-1363(+)
MEFVLHGTNKASLEFERTGVLTAAPDRAALNTPCCLLHTRAGHPPNMTQDLINGLPGSNGVMVSVQQLWSSPGPKSLKVHGKGLRSFVGYMDKATPMFMSFSDVEAVAPDGFNSEDSISVFSIGGRQKITVPDFVTMCKVTAPDVVMAMGDIQSAAMGAKRQKKAVDRTLVHLDAIIASDGCASLFGAIVGGKCKDERVRSAKETCKRNVSGFIIEGLDSQCLLPAERMDMVRSVVEVLPSEKPRGFRGCVDPFEVLELVACGLDVFDGAYAVQMAELGYAFTFIFGTNTTTTNNITDANNDGNTANNSNDTNNMLINLWEDQFEADFTQLPHVDYTRSYIHHLLNTHEMLAGVCLTTHNVAHYCNFFTSIRTSVDKGTFAEDVNAFKTKYQMSLKLPA